MSTDAIQEPPWMVAARDCGLSDKTLSVRIIEAACKEYSVALTEERDELQTKLDAARHHMSDAEQHIAEVRAKLDALTQENQTLQADRDRWEASWHKDISAARREIERLRKVLEKISTDPSDSTRVACLVFDALNTPTPAKP